MKHKNATQLQWVIDGRKIQYQVFPGMWKEIDSQAALVLICGGRSELLRLHRSELTIEEFATRIRSGDEGLDLD